ncbi:glycosyl transferase group 1 [Oscillochloris trichoides DG-6]|uniref:Glycosyl transferase group 1 n=1 Tax=Oscillochloris trichoides DG-6 TaxID=765420 RepID=E1IH22_9CHLR|nr:glycosyltransferase family 4 protein [Oscillochloris trichoides]EFO79497.1 glycosyl transferase group 1 [Oscillochloris trichoides DG-6]
MKILFLSPYPAYPPRGGGALRIWNLLRGLAQHHDITCLSFAPDAAAVAALAPMRAHCRLATVIGPPPRRLTQRAWTTLASPLPDLALRNATPAYREALSRLLAAERFDLVHAASLEMADYGLLARQFGVPLISLDQFNAEYLLQRRAALSDLRRGVVGKPRALLGGVYSLVQWRKLVAYERRVVRDYDRVLVVSAEDRAALARLAPQASLHVIPNGVDTGYFAPGVTDQGIPTDLVFTATLDYRPNIDALVWFVQQVLPRIRAAQPGVRLVVVGRAAGPAVRALHDGEAVFVVGEVDDVRPYIGAAAVYVVPMRIGGGSRLKLLEALALAAPVVSTPMGAEGITGLKDGEHLLLGATPAEFAAATLRLIADRELGCRLGAAGRAHVVAQYDWQAIIPRLEGVYGI